MIIEAFKSFIKNIITNIDNSVLFTVVTNIDGELGSILRYLYYKRKLRFCSGPFFSCSGFKILNPKNVSIDKNCSFNYNVLISASNSIKIGNNVLIGPNSVLRDSNHSYDRLDIPIRYQGHKKGEIIIGDDVWIGSNVVILKDTTIGAHSIIAANSLLNSTIPEKEVWGEHPQG